jgi:hypothetical protein
MSISNGITGLVLLLSLSVAPQGAYGQESMYHESAESAAAHVAGSCYKASPEVTSLFMFGIRDTNGSSANAARQYVTEERVFERGNPRTFLIGPHVAGKRLCTEFITDPGDLFVSGKQTPVVMQGTDGIRYSWAIRLLRPGPLPDSYVFLIAGPVPVPAK